jgi:hypothetical protein
MRKQLETQAWELSGRLRHLRTGDNEGTMDGVVYRGTCKHLCDGPSRCRRVRGACYGAGVSNGCADDAYSLSMLCCRCVEGIWGDFRCHGKLADIIT